MIDPTNITNYNLTEKELEEYILFWVAAAGKNGTTAARLIQSLFTDLNSDEVGAFNAIKLLTIKELSNKLKSNGIGCYNNKARTMKELAHSNLNLKTCTPDELETIYGIGMKTSRCFIIHSREGAPYAGIDTHMLKNLRAAGVKNVPKTTPGSKKLYHRLEKEVLRLSKDAGMKPAEYDLMIWNRYAVK